jgi:putative tryptophan/tyrosine transport system substrate-binding protein
MQFRQLKRREFMSLFSSVSLLTPFGTSALAVGRTYRVAFLTANPREAPHNIALLDELRRNGFIEGQNLMASGFGLRIEQFQAIAAESVKQGVDAILCGGGPATHAARQATRSIPILGVTDDMIAEGLVRSLARPAGNTTGISILAPELDGKRQDILMEAVPGARRLAALADPKIQSQKQLQALQDAAHARNVELSIHQIANAGELVPAIDAAKASGAGALNVLATPLAFVNRKIIIERTGTLRLPAVYQWPEIAEDGGFVAYGPRIVQIFRQVGRLLVKVLQGAKPSDLPVEQPTNFEFVVNLRAAKAIGHEVPAGLILRADKVIE